ncbi:DUF7019 family protein [Actinoallomurus soli]|uniref:DUF7019 family protein n=1 Tax=Actinoallomurus soli TaxID=2952535 RepID=UPI002092E993|nr:SAVMC3_10250 family protein [Actinoallomurus soli]MCO5971887.1 SAVMC3_10250 family protein [Actinoallomurus soli]
MAFRYYLYVSDAKVSMLLSQIDPGWSRKRVTEMNIGLKMAGARRTVETTGTDRFARLERVLNHLGDFGDLGDVDEPGQFVHGVLPMQWGAIGDNDTVYFGGHSERTVVGLGGSAGHVVSGATSGGPPQPQLSASLVPALLDRLAALAAGDEPSDVDALGAVVRANSALRGPVQTVEFVAKRMLYGPCPYPELYPHSDMAVLLGSPLYVALAE